MPSNIQVYSALLSSPRGIESDRLAAHRAIDEVNRFLKADNLSVELRDWERDVRPSVGADAQQVVNQQICDGCDLGLVLVHDRVGSPTPRARSGTIEEVEALLDRKERGENVDLVVFFKRPVVELSEEVLANLAEVLAFRKGLGDRGVFWKEYAEATDLEALIRIHLPGTIRALEAENSRSQSALPRRSVRAAVSPSLSTEEVQVSDLDSDELGSLDYELGFAEAVELMTTSLGVISAASEAVTSSLDVSMQRIKPLASASIRDPHAIRSKINEASEAIGAYNSALRARIPVFRYAIPKLTSSLVGMISISPGEGPEADAAVRSMRETVETVIGQVHTASAGFDGQRDALAGLPRMTKELNVAKREGVQLIDELIELWRGLSLQLGEVLLAIDRRLSE